MSFLSNENTYLLYEVCEDLQISKDELINYAKIFYDNYNDSTSDKDIMKMNKSFITHITYVQKNKNDKKININYSTCNYTIICSP